MIPIPETDPPSSRRLTLGDSLLRGIPRSYSILFFSGSGRLGWWLLAISMLSPDLGLPAMAGAAAAGALGWWLGYDRSQIRSGFLLFNPLLVCFTLAYLNRCYHFSPGSYVLLWIASVIGSLFLSVGMQHWVGVHVGTSAHSLPAVAAAYVLYFLGFSLYGAPIAPYAIRETWLELPWLPPFCQVMLQAFGAILFQPHSIAGILVFIGLAVTSPLSTFVAVSALAAGIGAMTQLGFPLGPDYITWCGFNFLLCGIALGTGYFITSGASLLLAVAGAAICALLSVALAAALRYFSLPASALPYNLVVLGLVYPLRLRWFPGALHPSPTPGKAPDFAARHALIDARRFPYLKTPALFLPCEGPRVITQAFDGAMTHRGPWQFALDFEAGQQGATYSGSGAELADYFVFGAPVLAPCPGVVAGVVNDVPDNKPGQNNPDANWGNSILLYSDAGYYVMLAHLQKGSAMVYPGQRVARGTPLGHCGNSGRSPIPHLHMHAQNTGFLGAVTRPFCIKHYIETAADTGRGVFHTAGFPSEKAHVRPASPNAALSECLYGWLPGEYRYQLTGENGKSWEETLALDFDEAGRYRLRSRRRGGQLSAFISEGIFFTTNLEGDDRSLLAFFGAGISRVPCINEPDVTWEDYVSTVPFLPPAARWLGNFAEPFFGPFLLRYTYSMKADAAGFTIHSALTSEDHDLLPEASAAPREITCRIEGRRGVVRLEARMRNDRFLKAELIEYRFSNAAPLRGN
jgi:urea transporter